MSPLTIFPYTTVELDLHQKNLAIAERKSHAAKLAHAKRKKPVVQRETKWARYVRAPGQLALPYRFKGNSDPFLSFPVPVTPRINRIITFTRDTYIPTMYDCPLIERLCGMKQKSMPQMLISRFGIAWFWQDLQESLQNECATYARLSAYSYLMSRVMPHGTWTKAFSFELRYQAYRLLRNLLAESDAIVENTRVCLHSVYSLFEAECIEGNVAAARVHASILQKAYKKGLLSKQMIYHTRYWDSELAIKKTHRTLFNLLPKDRTVSSSFMTTGLTDQHPHQCITNVTLRQLYLALRNLFENLDKGSFPVESWREANVAEAAYSDFSTSIHIIRGVLNDLLIDMYEMEVDSAERWIQAALTIAAQYLSRRIGIECIINGVDIRDASDELMKQLEYCVRRFMTLAEVKFRDAYQFVLYVGTMEEKRKFRVGDEFFTRQLSEAARSDGVVAWDEMKRVVSKFLYASFIGPDGSLWFADLVGKRSTQR